MKEILESYGVRFGFKETFKDFLILIANRLSKSPKRNTNPSPGEEVFKQPKPPKNVFYVQSSTPPEIIDVSPDIYYRQRAKDAETENVDAPTTSDAPKSQSE